MAMRKIGWFGALLAPILILIVMLDALPVSAQGNLEADRKALIQAIQERARRDVRLGSTPPGVTGLNILFGDQARAVGITPLDVLKVYEDAYEGSKTWWDFVVPRIEWIAAAAIFVLGIFAAFLKDGLVSAFKDLQERIYRRLAGHKLLRRKALRHYRKALVSKYQNIKIPFRPDQPLNMRELYVPLKMMGTNDADQIAADKSVAEFKRLVAVGAPGSGKSMLLRSLALAYAEGRLTSVPGNPIPILLELNRLNDSDEPLETHLVKVLELNDFPHAESFVNLALRRGELLLMFDGLDEVNIQRRPSVTKQIRDLLDRYDDCRAVITCRTAVYNQEFVDAVDATLELVEFNDQQVVRFLGAWKQKMLGDRSVEQLMHTLRDRPRIMALARNPLLLTVIAYMYTDTDFALPHNRAAFYEQSTSVLLGIWKQSANRYRDAHKRLILQHLALFNQDRRGESGPGGRSIDLQTALSEVKKVLPDLNIPLEQADIVIEEIVVRSGLLLSIDGGSQYQFAHLTIQEYFAAVALQNDQAGLFHRFRSDSNAWRETLMLWCGLGHDSSDLIQQVAASDPVTAFECLADAQKVRPDVADAIIGRFEAQLAQPDQVEETVLRAFAAVAADGRPRGIKTFEFLRKALVNGGAVTQERAAAALSFTNLARSAEVLASQYGKTQWVRANLVRLGNLAVPALAAQAEEGSMEAVDDLCAIGTHEAISRLIDILWTGDEPLNLRAACQLGGILTRSEFQDVVQNYSISAYARAAPQLDWIFPTDSGMSEAFQIVIGRIAYLLQHVSKETLPDGASISLSLVVPLLMMHRATIRTAVVTFVTSDEVTKFLLLQEPSLSMGDLDVDERVAILLRTDERHGLYTITSEARYGHASRAMKLSESMNLEPSRELLMRRFIQRHENRSWALLLRSISPDLGPQLLEELFFMEPEPTPAHWRKIWQRFEYQFDDSWHYLAIRVGWTLLSLVALVGMSQLVAEYRVSHLWIALLAWLAGMGLVGCILLSWWGPSDYRFHDNPRMFVYGVLLGLVIIPYATIDERDWSTLKFSPYMLWAPGVVVGVSMLAGRFMDWTLVGVLWASILAIGLVLTARGVWLEKSTRNPLRNIVQRLQLGRLVSRTA